MKRTVKWLVAILSVCLLVFAVAACDSCGEEHEHTFSAAFEYDDAGHWHKADCGHDVTSAKEAHTYKDGACTACGRKEDKEHEHTFGDTYEYDKDGHWKKATCGHNVTTDKEAHTYENGACTVCGRKEEQTHEHTFAEEWESNATHHWHEPTCGDTEEKGSYGEHDYLITEIVALTCTTDGVNRLTCKDCGFTEVETTKAAHLVTEESHFAALAATCENAGNIEYWECERCEKKFSDKELTTVVTEVERPKLSHNFELVSDKAANCTEYGLKVEKCSLCKAERNTATEPLGHSWSGKKTCISGRECDRKGCTVAEPALGHDYALIDRTKVDCTHDGSESYACNSCGDRYTTVTDHATGHNVADWEMRPYREVADLHPYEGAITECTYVQTGVCENENCPEYDRIVVDLDVTVERHEYSANITVAATCVSEGEKTYSCNICGHTHTESIPAVSGAHTWVNVDDDGNKITYNCSNESCGATKTAINAKNDVSAQVSADDLKANELELRNASLKFDESANIPTNAEVAVSTVPVNDLELDEEKKNQISGDVYDFAMLDKDSSDPENNRVTDFGGASVSVRVPYNLGEGEDPESIAIWYIDETGSVETIKATYAVVDGTGYAVFETTHFSYYTVTRLTNEERCALYGHSDIVTNKAKTCISDGYKLYTCRRCGRVEKNDIEVSSGHDLEETLVAATCTQAGSVTRACKNCDYGYTSALPAIGHTLVTDEARSKEATCLVSGITYHVCTKCDAEFVTTTAQKQHNYIDSVKEANCEEGGSRSRTCKDCGFKTVDNITGALGHNYAVIKDVAASCDTDGKTDYKCARCEKTHSVVNKKTGHSWDIDAPTCGRAQICVICAKVGLPATNEHTMTDGKCSVCGLGCAHEYERNTVDPTCTERGYTLVKCLICSTEERVGFKPALGHDGNFECERCHTLLVGDDYFTTLLNSFVNSEYTLKLTDLKIVDVYYGGENSITADEVYIGRDEDGELCAYGTLSVSNGDYYGLGTPSFKYTVAVEKGMVYVIGVENGSITHSEDGSHGFDDDARTTYMIAPLESFGNYVEFDYIRYVEGAYKWLGTDLKKIIDSLILVNKAAVSNVMQSLMDRVFTLSASGSDYTLVLNADGIAEINDVLYKNSIKDSIDILFGEGAYSKLRYEVEDILKNATGKEFNAKLAYRGVNSAELIKACDNLCEVIFGEGATLKSVLLEMTGLNIDVAAILRSDDLMLEIVSEIICGNKYDLTAEEILRTIDDYASANIYELISDYMGYEKTQLKTMIDDYIDIIADIGNLTLVTDRNGNLKYGSASAFGPIGELEVDGKLKILIGRQTEFDYDSFVSEVKGMKNKVVLDEAHFGAFWNELGAETHYYESGSIQSARYVEINDRFMNLSDAAYEYRNEYLQYRMELDAMNIDGGYTMLYVMRDENQVDMTFEEDPMIMLEKDCGEWYLGRISGDNSNGTRIIGSHVLKAVDVNGDPVMRYGVPFEAVLYGGSRYPAINDGGYSLEFFVSGASGEITVADNSSYDPMTSRYTRHVFVEDKSLFVEATGCEGVGIRYYDCSDCGKRIIEKYVHGHGSKGYMNRVKGGAKVADCTDGFEVERVCVACGKVDLTTYVEYHERFELEIIDLTEFGMADGCGGYAAIYGCFCGKSDGDLQLYDNDCDFEETWIYNNNWDDCFGVYACAVTDPVRCALRYSVKTYKDGCEVRRTYVLGCDKSGNATADSRTVDVLYSEKHDFEIEGELRPTGEPCSYEADVKCRICGQTETRHFDEHKNTSFRPYNHIGYCLYEGNVYCNDCNREVGYRREYRHEKNINYIDIEPTCSQYGMKGICGVCNSGVDLIEPLGHDFDGVNGACTRCGLESSSGVNGRLTLEDFTEKFDGKNYVVGYYDRDGMNYDDRYLWNNMYVYRLNLYFDVRVEIVYDNDGILDTLQLEGINYLEFGDDDRGAMSGHYVGISKSEVQSAVDGIPNLGIPNVPSDYDVRITFVPKEGDTTLDYSITLT